MVKRAWMLIASLAVLLSAVQTAPAAAEDPAMVEEALKRYWSGREMPIIKGGQLYSLEGRLEFTVFSGIVPNDPFTNYIPMGLRTGYNINGTFGVELDFAYLDAATLCPNACNSELTDFLLNEGAGIRRDVDLGDNQVLRVDAVAVFSPLYGKWSFQTYKISHFDLFVVAGLGMVVVNEPEFLEGKRDPEASAVQTVHFEGLFGAGFRFWLLDWMGLRMDARWMFYTNFEDKIQAPAEITLGLSFLTPAL